MVKQKKTNIKFDYQFETPLNRHVLHNVIVDMIKYILFARFQLPFPYITLQKQYTKEKNKWTSCPLANINTKPYRTWCKLSTFVQNFARISDSLCSIMERLNVMKVVVILGSTVISPKETLVIANNVEDDVDDTLPNSKASSICRNLLKTFITGDIFGGLSTFPPKNIFILICMDKPFPHSDLSDVFLPRNNFKEPTRGSVHSFDLSSMQSEEQTSMESIDFEQLQEDGDDGTSALGFNNWYLANLHLQGFKF